MRKDSDLLGEVQLSDDVYYGAQTYRALTLFKASKHTTDQYPAFIYSMGAIKKANALAHKKLGLLSDEKSNAICMACDEVMEGKFNNQFSIDMLSGNDFASIHMNINEVIACRANEIITGYKGYDVVHPNTHVNIGQSTCDAAYTAVKLGLYIELGKVIEVVQLLSDKYNEIAVKYKNNIKISHTCYQDALPTTFGIFYGASHSFLERQIKCLKDIREETLLNTIGYTVIGTGLGSFKGYHEIINTTLSEILGVKCSHVENAADDLQYGDLYLRISSILKSTMTGISKMAKDIRVMSSGPRAGFSEITIAPVQNGSSFFPGKVNPSLAELIIIATYQICGYDTGITMAVENGELDVTPWYPIFAVNLFNQCELMINTIEAFAEKCVATIQINDELNKYKADRSLGIAPAVTAMFGYENAIKVSQFANERDIPVRDAIVELGLIDKKTAESVFSPILTTDIEKSSKLLFELADKER